MNDLSELSAPLPVPPAGAQTANALSQAGEGRRKKKITRRVGYAREPSEEGPPASAKAVGGSNALRPQQPAASPATAVGAPATAVPQAAPAVGQRELPTPAHALVAAGRAFLMHSDAVAFRSVSSEAFWTVKKCTHLATLSSPADDCFLQYLRIECKFCWPPSSSRNNIASQHHDKEHGKRTLS